MANVLVEESSLVAIANAIRTKNGSTTSYKPSEMAGAIDSIETGGVDLLEKVLTNTLTEYSNDTLTSVKPYTFRNATKLKTLNLPNVTSIGTQSFHTCTGLTSVDFPNLTTLEAYGFTGCTGLTSVNFPRLTYLQASCLQSCTSLEVVDFAKVNQIGNLVFDGCTNLKKVILRYDGVCKLSNKAAFTNMPVAQGTGYIYIPDNLVESYKVAQNWSNYANQFKGLSELNE